MIEFQKNSTVKVKYGQYKGRTATVEAVDHPDGMQMPLYQLAINTISGRFSGIVTAIPHSMVEAA